MQVPDDLNHNTSDSMSYTLALPEIFDVGMDDSAPLATRPWMIVDHLTGEVTIDDNQSTPPQPVPPALTAIIPASLSLTGVEVVIAPRLGTAYLTESPPTLLSEDEDVRPQWLMTAINSFLHFVPYVGGLRKVIDLYLAQEARLGYPNLVCALIYSLSYILLMMLVHSPPTSISKSAHQGCHIYEMGQEVLLWR
jgi:hypothetical protein